MNKSEFENQIKIELTKNLSQISAQFDGLLGSLTEKIRGIYIGVFPSQDGDGFFNIHANADGPDLYVRQKEIQEFAELFGPKHTPNGIDPFIPTLDPFNNDFDVNDCVVDTVANWVKENFSDKNFPEGVTFQIIGDEMYGTITPITLAE